jgi:hypothetical protein
LLDLYGTTVAISRTCTVERTGIVTSRVYGASCGLDIASSTTNRFQIASGGRVHLVFASSTPKLWGLRMAGDQRVHLQTLHGLGRLTWSAPAGATPVIAYLQSATVVHIPPPSGTVLMVR